MPTAYVDDFHGNDDQRLQQAFGTAAGKDPAGPPGTPGLAPCQCDRAAEPCSGTADQEDLLCRLCRGGCLSIKTAGLTFLHCGFLDCP